MWDKHTEAEQGQDYSRARFSSFSRYECPEQPSAFSRYLFGVPTQEQINPLFQQHKPRNFLSYECPLKKMWIGIMPWNLYKEEHEQQQQQQMPHKYFR